MAARPEVICRPSLGKGSSDLRTAKNRAREKRRSQCRGEEVERSDQEVGEGHCSWNAARAPTSQHPTPPHPELVTSVAAVWEQQMKVCERRRVVRMTSLGDSRSDYIDGN